MTCEKLFILMTRLLSETPAAPVCEYFLIFFLFSGLMRPSSETGARPKTSVTATASTSLTTTNGQDPAESEEGADDDDHVSNIKMEWNFQHDFLKEKIRQRRLAVFEEQKRRLMKKSS